jgi:hypothetical protein
MHDATAEEYHPGGCRGGRVLCQHQPNVTCHESQNKPGAEQHEQKRCENVEAPLTDGDP